MVGEKTMHFAVNRLNDVQFAQAAPGRIEAGIADYPPFATVLCIVPLPRWVGTMIAK
jgi:hypothetical protein